MVGEEGLIELFKKAHTSFRALKVGTLYSWSRFVEAFLIEVTHHDATDAFSKTSHEHNIQMIRGLLKQDVDLILPFLLDDDFNEQNVKAIANEYNMRGDSLTCIIERYVPRLRVHSAEPTISKPLNTHTFFPPNVEHEISNPLPAKAVRHCIDEHGINLIAQFANEVDLFREVVSGDDIREILEARGKRPYHVKNNTLLGILIDFLESKQVLKKGWKPLMEKNHILYSASSTPEQPRFLTAHDLYQSVRSQNNYRVEFDKMMRDLAYIGMDDNQW